MALRDRDTAVTASQWLERARDAQARATGSGVAGFLAYEAMEATVRECKLWARLALSGYRAEFPALFTPDGTLVATAREVKTRFGWKWMIEHGTGEVTWHSPSTDRIGARRLSKDKAKGYVIGTVRLDAYVDTRGGNVQTEGAAVFPVPNALPEVVATVAAEYGEDR